MNKELYENSKDYINRWVISYADFVTMLFALFIVMWAITGGTDVVTTTDNGLLKKALQQEVQIQENPLKKAIEDNPELNEHFKVIEDKRGLILRSENAIFFDEGSADIKAEGLAILNEMAATLKDIDKPLIVEGHTDSTPINTTKFPSNWELSTARATNIVKYLINNCGYSPTRLSAVGYGEFAPITDNDNVKNRAKNRRVDIIILDKNN